GERPPGVAGVECRVGLDRVVDEAYVPATAYRQGPTERADHAGGPRARQPHRVSHRDHELADAQPIRVAEGRRRAGRTLYPQDGQVSEWIGAHYVETSLVTGGELGAAAGRARHHVRAGQHESVRGENHA